MMSKLCQGSAHFDCEDPNCDCLCHEPARHHDWHDLYSFSNPF